MEYAAKAWPCHPPGRGERRPHGFTAFCVRNQLGDGNSLAVGRGLIERGFELRSPAKNEQSQEQILQPGKLPSVWESKPFTALFRQSDLLSRSMRKAAAPQVNEGSTHYYSQLKRPEFIKKCFRNEWKFRINSAL